MYERPIIAGGQVLMAYSTWEKKNPGRIASTKIVILDSTDIQEAAPTQNYLFAAYTIALEIPAATVASTSQTKVP